MHHFNKLTTDIALKTDLELRSLGEDILKSAMTTSQDSFKLAAD